jgi:hypothetical protein
MSRNYREASKEKKANPFNPIFGLIIFLGLGVATYFAAEPAWEFVTTTTYSMTFFGQVLPLTFPEGWPVTAQQAVVGVFIFLSFFIFFTVIAIILSPKPTSKDDTYVDLGELRKEREERDKQRKKAARKAARRR